MHVPDGPFQNHWGANQPSLLSSIEEKNVRLPKKEHEYMSCFWLPHNSADGCGMLYILQTFKTPFPEEHEGVRSVCLNFLADDASSLSSPKIQRCSPKTQDAYSSVSRLIKVVIIEKKSANSVYPSQEVANHFPSPLLKRRTMWLFCFASLHMSAHPTFDQNNKLFIVYFIQVTFLQRILLGIKVSFDFIKHL